MAELRCRLPCTQSKVVQIERCVSIQNAPYEKKCNFAYNKTYHISVKNLDIYSPKHFFSMRPIRLLLTVVMACLTLAAGAQQRRVQHKPFIDERRFHYGFFVGAHDQSLNLENNGYTDPATGKQWLAQTDRTSFGFSVGVLGEGKMNRYLAVRVMPSLHFGSKHMTLRELTTGDEESQDMKSCYIGVPVNLKVAAPRFNNYRPYVVAGVAPMYDLTTGKHSKLKTKPFNLMLEAGMGCDVYLPFFKLIPELKFCFGLTNVLQKNRKDLTDSSQLIYTQSVDKATIGMVVLSFYFE